MNTEPTTQQPPLIKVARPRTRVHIPHLLGWLFAAFAVFVLVVLSLPIYSGGCARGPQTRALAQAKQVGLALKLFAADHDGVYPCLGTPQEITRVPTDANTAFACLFPTYVTSEAIFGNKLSAYQTTPADNVIDIPYTGVPRETLQPGENVLSYFMGLTEADNPHLPLVAEGTDGRGHYRRNPKVWGGLWTGDRVVIIRLDNSGALERVTGPDDALTVRTSEPSPFGLTPTSADLFDFSRVGKALRLLDPAVGPRRR